MIYNSTHSKLSFLAIAVISLGVSGFAFEDAFAAVPLFDTYVADDPDNADNVFSNGDTVTITFDIATNATGNGVISQAEINANFTDGAGAPDFGTTYAGVWSAGSTSLTVTITDVTGGALVIGADTIAGAGTTTIADADGGNADLISVGGDTATLSGDFGIVLPVGSECDRDCTPPTMGPGTDGDQIVSNGFSYNGKAVDAQQWYTSYPLITVETGKMNVLQAKIYDDRGPGELFSVTIAFGVPQIGKLYSAETLVDYFPNGIIGPQLNVIDKNNLLDKVSISTETTSCNDGANSPTCTLLTMEHMFREAPLANIVGITLADNTRNSVAFYFNHGIEVEGESLNPPQTAVIPLHQRGESQAHLTQIDRGEDLWIDEQNNIWSKNSFGTWFKITPDQGLEIKADGIAKSGLDRDHKLFSIYQSGQELIAKQVWDGLKIQGELFYK